MAHLRLPFFRQATQSQMLMFHPKELELPRRKGHLKSIYKMMMLRQTMRHPNKTQDLLLITYRISVLISLSFKSHVGGFCA